MRRRWNLSVPSGVWMVRLVRFVLELLAKRVMLKMVRARVRVRGRDVAVEGLI